MSTHRMFAAESITLIESEAVRKQKWGANEDHTRREIIKIYSNVWQQLQNMPRLNHTSNWIEYLLTDPPFLRSPNEVDGILNTLFRTALQENYGVFANLFAEKVTILRGSASTGLHDLNVQNEALRPHLHIEKPESIENLKGGTAANRNA